MDTEQNLKVYAVKHKEQNIVFNSRSGGIFTALSDEIISKDGIIFGCIVDENFLATHIGTSDPKVRDNMRGSKYVQSNIGNCYREIGNELIKGRLVLFSGTACQVAGLKSYIELKKISVENLITVEILCHGVPSPGVWKDNINWVQNKYKKTIQSVDFRNKKKYGWKRHVETYKFTDKTEYDSGSFTKLFTRHYILRPACFKCPYKGLSHSADITIADCWGIENVSKEMDDNKGTSLVLINSAKGEIIFGNVKDQIISIEANIEDVMQPPLVGPFPVPNLRDQFWREYHEKGYAYVIRKYASYTFKQRFIDSLPYIMREIARTKKL